VKSGALAALLLTATFSFTAQPVLAAAANDNVLSEGQKNLHETLKTTPNGNQYQGIEYPQVDGEPFSDREITQRIEKEVPGNIKLSVSNGAVRLSGQVNNREVAQRIVQDIKEIPGVHEVSYDLGLSS
jgi:osmotically-inducible protein OsmY